jgi:predicted metal-dependent hydrolase
MLLLGYRLKYLMTASPEFERGIAEFNQQQFYACHDTLEAIWIDAPEMDKRFYQGILQVAVGCYHLSNDNLRGAIILLGEAVRRLCDYQPDYQGVDVELLLQQAVQLLHALQQLQPEQAKDFFAYLQHERLRSAISSRSPVESPADNSQSLADLAAGCQLPYIQRI